MAQTEIQFELLVRSQIVSSSSHHNSLLVDTYTSAKGENCQNIMTRTVVYNDMTSQMKVSYIY